MSLDFVKMTTAIHQRRYLNQFQNLIHSKTPCGFFFSFPSPDKISFINAVKNSGFNLKCVLVLEDAHKKLIGDVGLPVFNLSEFADSGISIKTMIHMYGFFEANFHYYFQRYGIEIFPLVDAGNMENLFNFYVANLPQLYEVHEMLADEESKKIFRAYIMGKLTRRVEEYIFAPEPQYFFEGFIPGEGDIAIDGGAYDGATSRDFAMQGAKVYAFEMSTQNFKKCVDRAEKYNFVVENIGLSNRECEENYVEDKASSRKGGGFCRCAIH